jgi:3-methyladenine DNA glycosylase AlkD
VTLPEIVVGRLTGVFEANRDPVRAAAMAAYMRDRFPFLGIAAPRRRALAREALAGLAAPDLDELARAALALWEKPEREYQYAGADYVCRHVARCSARFLPVLERLITAKPWWDTVDALSAHGVGPLVRCHPELVLALDRWIDGDLWLARAAILHQLAFEEATDAERLFRYCLRRAADRDLFLRKAIGWALREHSRVDPGAVAAFVAEHESELSPLSRREALRRLPRP